MPVGDLLDALGYADSPNFLQGKRLGEPPGFSHIFRRAESTCSLQGVYILSGKEAASDRSLVPLVYVCEAQADEEARRIHQKVWNQNVVPFLLVASPTAVRLYSGFRYARPEDAARETTAQGVLRTIRTFNTIGSELADFHCDAIDRGKLWGQWESRVNPRARVDWHLLEQLEKLGSWLRGNRLGKTHAHALIGKYVYLRYLKDRDILSDRKFADWGVDPNTVFGRQATLKGVAELVRHLEEWLNGKVFPLDLSPDGPVAADHLRRVAGVFAGDDPISGQQQLDFQPYDFSHIPVETLSVIYEQFLHAEGRGKREGAYYTPVPLVEFMLQELDDRLPLEDGMKVLDASCGSGAFLVQCYRRLIEKHLRATANERPKPGELRDLLVRNIYGVDRDEDACRVAQLSLVLTLLDYIDPPDLRRHSNFKIPALHDTNIIHRDFFAPNNTFAAAGFEGGFDWVVGNPPWVEVEMDKPTGQDRYVARWIRNEGVVRPTGGNQSAEAFAWKLKEYLSPGGVAGLLLPAMTLFKYESEGFRKAFFRDLDVWCVANFANMAEVLFAGRARLPAAAFFYSLRDKDKEPAEDAGILLFAPFVANQEANRPINRKRRKDTWNIVVNASEVKTVPLAAALTGDQLTWKIAMWGGPRDGCLLNVLRKRFSSLEKFAADRKIELAEGVQLRTEGTSGTEFVQDLVDQKLLLMEKLRRVGRLLFTFPTNAFRTIKMSNAYVRSRGGKKGLGVCVPPHVVVDAARRFAVFTDEYVVVPPRQIGIAGSRAQTNLLKALSLFLVSEFATYFQFFASPGWGVKRERATLQALKEMPVALEHLPAAALREWAAMRDDLVEAVKPTSLFEERRGSGKRVKDLMRDVNDKVYAALELTDAERYLVEDFVRVRLFLDEGKIGQEATGIPTSSELQAYARTLKRELDDFLESQPRSRHEVTVVYDGSSGAVGVKLRDEGVAAPVASVEKADRTAEDVFAKARTLLKAPHSQWIYFDRNLLVLDGPDTYIFKPLQRFHWTRSQALVDADQIIAETLVATGE